MAAKILVAFIVILFAIGVYAMFIEPRRLSEKHFLIRKDKSRVLDISEAYDMFQNEGDIAVAHISDLHFSRWYKPRRLNKVIASLRENRPDLIVFTGDLIDDYKKWPVKQTPALVDKLKKLQAPMGKIAVLGNHDYKSDGSYFVREILQEAGFTVLINEDVFGSDEKISLNVAGIADPASEQSRFYFEPTLAEWQILLLHQPDYIERIQNLDMYDLVLSGHSHGGQIRFASFYPKTYGARTYTESLYLPSENTLLSVNTGIGTTGLPLRFGVPPEIVYYHLSHKTEPFKKAENPFDFKSLIEETKQTKSQAAPVQDPKTATNPTAPQSTPSPAAPSDPTVIPGSAEPVVEPTDKVVDLSLFRRRYHDKKRTVS